MLRRLDLTRYHTNADLPTLLCETAEEFYGAIFGDEPLSETQLGSLLDHQVEEARRDALNGGGIWGLFLPHRGCLLNGWLYARIFGAEPPAAVLEHAQAFPHIIRTAAHEKWGHGFLSTATALGRETQSLHVDRYRYAQGFPEATVTTPEGLVLREKWHAVFSATRFAEEGWSTWVEHLALNHGTEFAPVAPKTEETAAELAETMSKKTSEGLSVSEAAKAIRALLNPGTPPADAMRAMACLEQAEEALTPGFVEVFGQPPRYVLGYAVCRMLCERFGEACVPVALVLAGNVTYAIERISVSDLQHVVTANDSMNVNRRLAALAHLPVNPSGKSSPGEFGQVAHELLGFAVPESLRIKRCDD
ncbi:MAG: hypothetical protein HN976_43560 [Lentisphaerae bacterium]|nr:hypothetical protein [Lentisphaerota bacterium]MBT7062042.1 hypothetical protein [Lentisphaerota bacterium]